MERIFNFFQTIIFLFIFLLLVAIYFSGKNPPYDYPTNTSEHKYIEDRFKSEGYSKDVSKAAADAIYKFEHTKKREW